MSSLQPCSKFVKKGLDKAFFMCCNSKQFRFLEEWFFKKAFLRRLRRMKAISTHQYLYSAVSSDNNNPNKNKQRKKEGTYV